MALQQKITLPDTTAQFDIAYGRVDDALIILAQGKTEVTLNWYVNTTAAQVGAKPVRPDRVSIPQGVVNADNPEFVQGLRHLLNLGLISSPLDALKAALYLLVHQQAEYQGAVNA